MKVILDTNVLLSGFFFGGLPGRIIEAWRDGLFTLVLSGPILAEYRATGAEFEASYDGSDFESFAALILLSSEVVDAPDQLPEQVCSDPDDDKFLACALAANARVIVSGDRRLRDVSGWNGIHVLSPREFVELHMPHSA